MQWLYLVAAILGTILLLSQFIPFPAAHGFDMPSFFRQLFANNVSAFFGVGVIVSSLVLWLFAFSEGRRGGSSAMLPCRYGVFPCQLQPNKALPLTAL